MTVWFVSRHQGAIDWAVRESGFSIDRFEQHLNTDEVADGDVVFGTLPLHLAADVCAKGAVFYFLQLPQELSGRGSEYTADEMVCMGARLRRFDVSSRED